MNKKDLIAEIAAELGVTKVRAEKYVESMLSICRSRLLEGERIALIGLGTFTVKQQRPRKGRDMNTGKPVYIPARKTVKFKPSKDLVAGLN